MKSYRLKLCLLIVACLIVGIVAASTSPSRVDARSLARSASLNRKLTVKEERWVERTLSSLSIEEKVGQLVSTDANAVFMNRDSEAYRRLVRHVAEKKVGSLILFRSDVWASAILVNRLQTLARVPLLVSADLEMGPGMRFDDTVWWAPNMAVAATGDIQWAFKQGQATAIEARAIGVNWLFAPVADINNNPDNPVINTRSFGENPETVSAYVKAFIDGAQAAGALATAKHFPGHGDTATDSHIGLPVINVSRERLDLIELVPFRAAIAAGVGAIMSAHISLPQIETELSPPVRKLTDRERDTSEFLSLTESEAPQVTLPGTLSAKVMTNLLREELQFKGLVTTDAMSMAGVAARFDPGTAAIRAIKAGADIVLKSPDVDAAVEAIKDAVARGEITRTRLDSSVRRILSAKARLGLNGQRLVNIDDVDRVVSSSESQVIAQEIADRSMTLIRDEKKTLPLEIGTQTRILSLTVTDEEDRAVLAPFLQELRRRTTRVENVVIDSRTRYAESDWVKLRGQMSRSDLIILSVVIRVKSGKGSLALPGAGDAVLAELRNSSTPLIAISFGNPYLIQAMPDVPAYLAAFSVVPVSQRAAGRAILGEIEINGRLPVSLPGLFPIGHGLRVARK
ncbi:MAG: glycoside hydrolase family 3 N-terminal domain-containing protein [Acidobacteriota bacterium]